MATPWRNRIIGHGDEAPESLLANPANFRIHPQRQQAALSDALDRVGYIQNVIVNQRTQHVIDGHLRVALAISRNQPTIPVVYVDLSDAEERLALATFDPIGSLAVSDREALASLMAMVAADDPSAAELLGNLTLKAPAETVSFEVAPAETCPTCGQKMRGKPTTAEV